MRPKFAILPLFLLGIVFAARVKSQQAGHSGFELVESSPIETVLDNEDIRNTQEVWLEMINHAKKTLDIEQFYISNQPGEPLEAIITAIESASDRGVTVRLISESKFYKTYPETINRLRKRSIEVRLIDFGKIAGGVQHAKYFIVDSTSVFLGSQNFDWRSLKHIRELGLRIDNTDAARIYLDIFALDWKLAASGGRRGVAEETKPHTYDVPLVSVSGTDTIFFTPTCSPIGWIVDSTLWDEPNIVRLIRGARHQVSLQFLGYGTRGRGGSDYRILDDALRQASGRGVKIRLLVADWEKGTPSEHSLKELAKIPNVEVKFSSIPEWSGGYVSFARVEHSKFVLVDSSSFWLGTANAERSYFHTSRNLGVIVRNAGLCMLVHRVFEQSWNGPYAELVDPDTSYTRREHGERQ